MIGCKKTIKLISEAGLIQKQHFFYKPKCFPHLVYINKLIRNLKPGVQKVTKKGLSETALRTEFIIKITYVGEITDDNLRLVSKRKGKILLLKVNITHKTFFLTYNKRKIRQRKKPKHYTGCFTLGAHKVSRVCRKYTKAVNEQKACIFYILKYLAVTKN